MAKKDTVTKSYMEDRNMFADLVNFYVYNGEKVVKPENLHPLDTTAAALPHGKGKSSKTVKTVQKHRDVLKYLSGMADEDLNKFSTELKQVFKYLKYSSDKEKLSQIVNEDEVYKHISRRTAVMINTVSGTKMKISSGKDEVDMCKAIEDMRKEEREKGIEEGRNEGIIETLSSLVNDGLITLETAASRAGMTVKEFEARLSS